MGAGFGVREMASIVLRPLWCVCSEPRGLLCHFRSASHEQRSAICCVRVRIVRRCTIASVARSGRMVDCARQLVAPSSLRIQPPSLALPALLRLRTHILRRLVRPPRSVTRFPLLVLRPIALIVLVVATSALLRLSLALPATPRRNENQPVSATKVLEFTSRDGAAGKRR